MNPHESIRAELDTIHEHGLTRHLRTLEQSGGHAVWDGRELLNLSSNDYLNLANDERVKAGAIRAVEEQGGGATASRLMAGHLTVHERLEQALAEWLETEACLVFPSGYQANIGMICSLVGPDGAVFSDALNHASIVDGCRLSRAPIHIYEHANADALESMLQSVDVPGRKLIVSDSVFSMDGDRAPVEDLFDLAEEYGCLLAIDEAHAIGVFGEGRGVCAEQGVVPDVIVGTMTKALGSGGGFVACSRAVQSLIVNRARSFIFSTGLSPANAGASLAALEVIQNEPTLGTELMIRARAFVAALREAGIESSVDHSQIVPILVGDNARTVRCMEALLDLGILLAAVRPPTVPQGTSRLRVSVTLGHEIDELKSAAAAIARVVQKELG